MYIKKKLKITGALPKKNLTPPNFGVLWRLCWRRSAVCLRELFRKWFLYLKITQTVLFGGDFNAGDIDRILTQYMNTLKTNKLTSKLQI